MGSSSEPRTSSPPKQLPSSFSMGEGLRRAIGLGSNTVHPSPFAASVSSWPAFEITRAL